MTIATGQQMLASDINDLTFFPKGTILTFSSAAWSATSANFKTIWKICNAANHAVDANVPDLTNKFLRGAESSGTAGGADSQSVTLQSTNLPSHSHTAGDLSLSGLSASGLKATSGGTHEHILTGKAASAGLHAHGITDPGHSHSIKLNHDERLDKTYPASAEIGHNSTASTESSKTGITISNGGSHEHSFSSDSKASSGGTHEHNITGSITGGSISGSTGSAGSGQAFNVDTVPSYYTVIYIIKVA